jgi:hypothetical protein
MFHADDPLGEYALELLDGCVEAMQFAQRH